MNCPYCNNEMEKGRIMASATGSIPIAKLDWFAEKDFEEKGFRAALKRKSVGIKSFNNGGYYPDSNYCEQCKKVFAEFSTK